VRRNATELQRRDAHSLSSCLRACALARASEVRRVARSRASGSLLVSAHAGEP
jgi:hypothetical protein